MMLPPIHCGSFNSGVSSSGDSELSSDETDPQKVSIPHGLIFSSHLGKIISWYHILLGFVYRVPNSDEFISTPSPLKVAFCEKAFKFRLRIPLHPFTARFL